jgi:hypothetical protein
MRDDAPAARMTPANEGERAMGETISYLVVEEIVYGAIGVDQSAQLPKLPRLPKIAGIGSQVQQCLAISAFLAIDSHH